MAFVRVKRRHDEDPFNSIVVSHKKLKAMGTGHNKDCVFQFAATVTNESESLSQILKEVQEGKSVKFLTKAKKKIMHNVVEHSKSKRLQLVNTLRAVKQDTVPIEENNGENSEIKVVDFVKQTADDKKSLIDEGISIDYVYDLYYVSNNDNKSIDIQDIDSVHGLDSDKFYDICKKMDDSDDSSSSHEDEDDSNDEGNWRNDYPDEDEMENSEDDDCQELVHQSKRWNLDTYDSSIDNEDEDSDNLLDCDDYDDYDSRFAKYKERVKAEEHFYYNSVLEDSSNGSSNSD